MVDIEVLSSGSRGNCYIVDDGSAPLLLECGIRMQMIRERTGFRLQELAGCLISHEHKDHCRAVEDMLRVGVDCYMSQGTAKMLCADGHRVHMVVAKEQFKIKDWIILPFDTKHDAEEPLGFLLWQKGGPKILYATDTYYIKYRFSGLTHIMLECNYSLDVLNKMCREGMVDPEHKNRVIRSHMSLETAADFFRANDLSEVRGIWLLHLSDDNSHKDRFKRKIQSVTGKPVYIAGS